MQTDAAKYLHKAFRTEQWSLDNFDNSKMPLGIRHPELPPVRPKLLPRLNRPQEEPFLLKHLCQWLVYGVCKGQEVELMVHDHYSRETKVLDLFTLGNIGEADERLLSSGVRPMEATRLLEVTAHKLGHTSAALRKKLAFELEYGGMDVFDTNSGMGLDIKSVVNGCLLGAPVLVTGSPVVVNGILQDMGFISIVLYNKSLLMSLRSVMGKTGYQLKEVPFMIQEAMMGEQRLCRFCQPGILKFCACALNHVAQKMDASFTKNLSYEADCCSVSLNL